MPAHVEILAHLGHYLGTIGFFVPAVILVGIVVGAVVRDRRLHAREDDDTGDSRDDVPATPPRSD